MNDKRKCGDNHCYCHNIQEIRMSPHFFLTDNDEYHTLWNTGRYSRADCRTLRPGTHSFDRRNRNLRSVAPRPENNRTPAVAGSLQRLDASRGCDRCSHHLRVRNLRCGRHDMLRGSSGKNLHTLRRSGRRRAGSGVIPAARCHLHPYPAPVHGTYTLLRDSPPSSRKPTGSTSETTYSRKNERDSIFKFFPARICSDLFRLCKKSAGKNFHNRLSPRNRPCS